MQGKYDDVELGEKDMAEITYVDREAHEQSIWEVALMEDDNLLKDLPAHSQKDGTVAGGCAVS